MTAADRRLVTYRLIGLERMAEVDIGLRQNRHRPLSELGPMSEAVMAAILDRAGVPSSGPAFFERPRMVAVLEGLQLGQDSSLTSQHSEAAA